jgi:hypothetical protein
MLWAWLSRSWRGWRTAVHIVKPETVSENDAPRYLLHDRDSVFVA